MTIHQWRRQRELVGAEAPFKMLERGPQYWGLGARTAVQKTDIGS